MSSQRFPVPETNAYYELKAIGGAASVCVGDAVICSDHGRFNSFHLALDNPAGLPSMTRLSESITRHGAVAALELSHSGSNARQSASEGNQLYGPMEYVTQAGFQVEAMDGEKIYKVVEQFASAALWAKRCGFGMVTIHGGHGWLLTEFMSPITNQRTDKWGGSVENRCRFVVDVCKAIRKAVGPGFPIEMRISGSECTPKGYDLDEGIAIAKQLDGHLDLIHVSAGSHEVWEVFTVTHPDMFLEDGVNVKYAAEIKKHVKTPVATVGALADPAHMEEIIASGKADVVQVARGLIADPDLPVKARMGKDDEIIKCMRCMTCFSNHILRAQFLCPLNPVIGHELESMRPAFKVAAKKVLVAGGGVGGMQAAITAAERGHDVVLCEKTSKLGGVLNCEHDVPFKKNLIEYLEKQAIAVGKTGVEIRLNEAVTLQSVKAMAPDVILAAIGACAVKPNVPGIESTHVFSAESMYSNARRAVGTVAVLGGGLVGCELAIYLSGCGHQVVIIEMEDKLDDGGNMLQGLAVRLELERRDISVFLSTEAIEITEKVVVVRQLDGIKEIEADTVVYAVGLTPRREEAEQLRELAPEFHILGDCLSPKNIVEATRTAFHISRSIGRF